MRVLLLDKDKHYEPCAMITAKKSTITDIQKAIYKVWEIDCYNMDDLEAGLPNDCTIVWFDFDADNTVVW